MTPKVGLCFDWMTLVLFLSAEERVYSIQVAQDVCLSRNCDEFGTRGRLFKKKKYWEEGEEGQSKWEHLHSIWHTWAGNQSEVQMIINKVRKGEQNNQLREESVELFLFASHGYWLYSGFHRWRLKNITGEKVALFLHLFHVWCLE